MINDKLFRKYWAMIVEFRIGFQFVCLKILKWANKKWPLFAIASPALFGIFVVSIKE